MQRILLSILLIILFSSIAAQQQSTTPSLDSFYCGHIETESEFPGGTDSLKNFIHRQFIIPDSLLEGSKELRGTIIANFIIDKEGCVSEVIIAKSLEPSLDKELIRVLKILPKWTPATQNGRLVKSYRRIPVTIIIEEECEEGNALIL